MKRVLLIVLAFIFGVTVARAIGASREAQRHFDGETWFEKVGATGNTNTGNPGYIALQSDDRANVPFTYYLWVDSDGDLRVASYPTISAYSSFPTGNWGLPAFTVGTVVGSQS